MEESGSYFMQQPVEETSQEKNQSIEEQMLIETIKALVELTEKLIKKKNKARSLMATKEFDANELAFKMRDLRGSNIRRLMKIRKMELANLQKRIEAFQGPERPRRHKESAKYSPIGDRVVSDMKQSYPFSPGSSYDELISWSYEMMSLKRWLTDNRRSNNPGHELEESIEARGNVNYKLRHGIKNQTEERKLLREIKQAEPRKIGASTSAYGYSIPDYLGSKEDILERIQLIHKEGKGLNKENQEISNSIKRIEVEVKAAESEILSLQKQIAAMDREKEKLYERIYELREEGTNQVDTFVYLCKVSEIFRFEYEKNKPEIKRYWEIKRRTQNMATK